MNEPDATHPIAKLAARVDEQGRAIAELRAEIVALVEAFAVFNGRNDRRRERHERHHDTGRWHGVNRPGVVRPLESPRTPQRWSGP